MSSIKIACGQLCSSSNLLHNARVVKKLIHKAVKENVKVLFLPEASDYISRDAKHSMQLAQSVHKNFISLVQTEIRSIYLKSSGDTDDKGLFVAVGVHEPSQSQSPTGDLKKVRNNQLWIDNKGEILQTYQKIHLFDVNIKDGPILKESNSVEPGNSVLKPFQVNSTSYANFSIGFAICYDIRFPELGIKLRKLGANIITYPSAFTVKTGESHWKELGKARALDTQCYVVMAAQCGEHDTAADLETPPEQLKKRVSYGESIIISPWGEVLSECKKYSDTLELDEEGDYYELCFADLDLDSLDAIRTNMPLLEHRREDIFGEM
ncbi:uncharacterized protein PRCAT00002679001 [Priceomyces carsonii]|uniref:uncharacterized protein n=1 Tax=Priceomyces carsonii TaxID=28549 RepID=UPI002EDAD48A|nr:unnamed protein product [Priceomyces carsonii]